MTGQNRKDPFHVNRDKVNDNLTVVRKLRLPRGSQIRARLQFATVDNAALANVSMPYTGTLRLTVTTGGSTILINNPFVRLGPPATLVVVDGAPAGVVATVTSAGQISITGGGVPAGTYIISVGQRTDRRKNGAFSQ